MRAKDVMSRGVVSVTSDASIFEAAEALTKCGVSAMPVVDADGHMVGIVSEADLIRRAGTDAGGSSPPLLHRLAEDVGTAAAYVHANSHRVVDVMTTNVITVDENAPLGDVAELMLRNGIKRLPVRSGDAIVGMVSRIDLLRALMPHLAPPAAAAAEVQQLPSSDEELRRHVLAAVRNQSWSVPHDIDVAVSDGIVHLWGRVPSEIAAQAHLIAIGKVPGVRGIENHLHVVQPVMRLD
ncbi:MAG: CBS domain-containing protein [Proteobacteria bacterium]|nr:CBS domain-containing protein [Pseudomonadota bacterium]